MKRARVFDLLCALVVLAYGLSPHTAALAQLLDKQKLLEAQSFWDNRDWDWYRDQIPFFECPDADINTTYYYRWELVTSGATVGNDRIARLTETVARATTIHETTARHSLKQR